MSYYMADRKHRKAFLEARQSLEVKMNLEEQSQQQVRLGDWEALGEEVLGLKFVLRDGVCKEREEPASVGQERELLLLHLQ